MSHPTHIFSEIKLFVPNRQVFDNSSRVEIPPTQESYEGFESLSEAFEVIKEALAEADRRLQKIRDEYKGEAKIPYGVKEAYLDYKEKRKKTYDEYEKLRVLLNYKPGANNSIEDAKRDIVKKTLEELDAAFSGYLVAEKGPGGDPMDGLPKDIFRNTPKKHVSRKRKQVEEAKMPEAARNKAPNVDVPPPSKEEKRSVSRKSPEYWNPLYRDISLKLIGKAVSGSEVKLSLEEETAARIMNPGETKSILIKGKPYLLERDNYGNYLRLRNYRKQHGQSDMADPYIAITRVKNLQPRWSDDFKKDKIPGKEQREALKSTSDKEQVESDANKQIDWLFSKNTPAGSTMSFWHIVSREKIADTGNEKHIGMQVEMLKKYDGGVQAKFLRQAKVINAGKPVGDTETILDKTVKYPVASSAKCRKDVMKCIQNDSQITVTTATKEDTEKERLAYVYEQLDKAADNLTKASVMPGSIFPWLAVFQKIIDREKITNWEQNPEYAFLDRHIIVKNGKVSILELNPEYKKYQEERNLPGNPAGAVPQKYLAVHKDARLPEDQLTPERKDDERLAENNIPPNKNKNNKPA